MKTKLWAEIKTIVMDAATNEVVKESDWTNNLVADACLNGLANHDISSGFAGLFETCKVGSSNTPNSYASGGITFTQTGTTITASAGFFTAAMTGALLKYGTGAGGAEVYITYVSSTQATAGDSLSIGPVVGTVWMVQQTTLGAYSYSHSTYDTSTGACSYTVLNNVVTLKRTFVFSQKVSPYPVNEIGYHKTAGNSSVYGRVVLPTTDVISPSQYYVVVCQISYAVSPGVPTAVLNVGTNYNVAGTVMFQHWDCFIVNSSGSSVLLNGSSYSSGLMDYSENCEFYITKAAPPALNSYPSVAKPVSSNPSTNLIKLVTMGAPAHGSNPAGVGTRNNSFSVATNGETVYGFNLGKNYGLSEFYLYFILVFTTPFALPVGTFAGTVSFQWSFSRSLVN